MELLIFNNQEKKTSWNNPGQEHTTRRTKRHFHIPVGKGVPNLAQL